MSLTKTWRVTCDAPGCAVSSTAFAESATARHNAIGGGWIRADRPAGWTSGKTYSPRKVDVCPNCAQTHGINSERDTTGDRR